jgi:hypothetical protein
MIEYMKSQQGVWFVAGRELAEWWLKHEFSVKEPKPIRAAAG